MIQLIIGIKFDLIDKHFNDNRLQRKDKINITLAICSTYISDR